MKEKDNFYHRFALLIIAIFLILTAWGNAVAMLIFSAIALIALTFYRRGHGKKYWSVVFTGFVVAGAVVFFFNFMG